MARDRRRCRSAVADRRLHRVPLRPGEGARPLAEPAAAAAPARAGAAAGAAALLPLAHWLADDGASAPLEWLARRRRRSSTSLLVAGEATLTHRTAHARLAAWEMTRGRYRRCFWAGVALVARRPSSRLLARRRRRAARARSACSPTSTPTSRPASRCRWHERSMTRSYRAARLSAALEPRPLAAFPPKERWDDWVELDSKAWPQRVEQRYMLVPDDLLQLRVGLRPARLRRPRDAARSASSRATPSTRARAGATAPRARRRSTRSPIPTASSTRSSAPARAARDAGSG